MEKGLRKGRSNQALQNNKKSLAKVNPQDVLDMFEQGMSMPKVAKAYGVTHQAMYRFLLTNAPNKWREYQSAKALSDLDESAEKLDNAKTQVQVSSAREKGAISRWILERACRGIYGHDGALVQINVSPGSIPQKIKDLEAELLGKE